MHDLQCSTENYLEAIYLLHAETGHVRSIDVANFLDISRPSVSKAVKKLSEEKLLTMEEDGQLILTESGRLIGCRTVAKHEFLKELLLAAGIDEESAEEDACRIEHAITDENFVKLRKHLQDKV